MRVKLLSGLLAGVFFVALSFASAFAAEDHMAEALKQAGEAAGSGKKGEAKAVCEHAEGAKIHAEAAEKEKPNEHLSAAIRSLDGAIKHCKMGHADVAGKAAEEAVNHLKAAQ